MSIGDVFLAYEDAMELTVLTNPFGNGDDASKKPGDSQSRTIADETISSADIAERGLGHVYEVNDLKQLPPHIQDLVRDFTGKGVT